MQVGSFEPKRWRVDQATGRLEVAADKQIPLGVLDEMG